jgi:membrane-associated phospholipid phosphatase
LAEILNQSAAAPIAPARTKPLSGTNFWAVDKVILAYFAFSVVLLAAAWSNLPGAPALLTWHLLGAALVIYQVKRPNRTSWFFRNWYPLPYVAYCYKEMAAIIPALRRSDADRWLARLDFRMWHAHPCVWLERISTPALTEFLQIIYTLFVPVVLLVPFLLWRSRRFADFRYCAFLIAVGFLTSYLGYLLVPARGPRFFLKHLQHIPLQGLWLFRSMQNTLDRLESVHYDCFPSGHTELTLIAWWLSRLVSNRLFRIYFAYTPFLIFATVYLRYHYTVDLFAGAAFAAVLILASPAIYRKLS